MRMNSVQKISEEFLDFLKKRELNNLVNLFSETIEWEVPGNLEEVKWLGKRNSKEEVKGFFKLLWSQTEPVSASIAKIFFCGTDAVITGEFSTKC